MRLGAHLSGSGVLFTRIFSSDLRRAVKTANLIDDAQLADVDSDDPSRRRRWSLPVLREKDFGSLEGVSWVQRSSPSPSKPAGGRTRREVTKADPDFVPPESAESVNLRTDSFLADHIWPLVVSERAGPTEHVVAVVSHGITLSHLWQRLVRLMPAASLALSAALRGEGMVGVPDRISWINTGYLEIFLQKKDVTAPTTTTAPHLVDSAGGRAFLEADSGTRESRPAPPKEDLAVAIASDVKPASEVEIGDPTRRPAGGGTESLPPMPMKLHGCTATIIAVNSIEHLRGLKRTRGGVGSSVHSESQKSLETFFKRKKPN